MPVCEKCGCNDIKYFGLRNGQPYCRRCISFNGEVAKVRISDLNQDIKEKLDYKLSEEQENLSNKIKEAYLNKKNSLIYAVCGSGKTELVYKTISAALSRKRQVGFAIPRKDVVIELVPRIQSAFPNAIVTAVYGGHTGVLEGDIIVLTTHQLYRYKNYFDLLIIDETDAFPFSGNEELLEMFNKSIRGNYIMMSATPLEWMKDKIKRENGEFFTLMKRYHGHPLIVPKIRLIPFGQWIYVVIKLIKYRKEHKPCFVFCPTIDECESLFNLVHLFVKDGKAVHSKKEGREEIVDSFKNGHLNYLITTSILERGVTVKNIQVIVTHADSSIYTSAALVQISGRAGRKIDAYEGDVIFLTSTQASSINEAINIVKDANKYVDV